MNHPGKRLTYAEYETATALYRQIIGEGHDPAKAIAILYHQGRIDGYEELKQHTRERQQQQWERRQEKQKAAANPPDDSPTKATISPPEATTEGSNDNE